MRKSDIFFRAIAAQLILLAFLLSHAALSTRGQPAAIREMSALAAQLKLTDLCLFTEARYTRHPSQADLNTPFQDHPFSLEHFPSGSFLAPPAALRTLNEKLD